MSEIPFIPSMRPEPVRDITTGMYKLPHPESGEIELWERATTIAHTLDDTGGLTKWKRRMVLTGAALSPGVLTEVPQLARDLELVKDDWRAAKKIKKALDKLCDEAAKAAGDGEAAALGTLLHTITEYYDAGRLGEIEHLIPKDLDYDLDEYASAMRREGIERPPEFIERITVNTQVSGAGTFDRLLRLPDGRLVVGDLKTGGSVNLGALGFAIQLAEYAYADAMYDDETGQLVPMPADLDKTVGIIIHLPVGKARCELYEIDLVEGWQAALEAHWVRQRRDSAKALLRPYVAPAPASSGDRVLTLIRGAGHVKALEALWKEQRDKGTWTPAYTQAAAARKAELLAEAVNA